MRNLEPQSADPFDIASYYNLIAKLARKYWYALPPDYRVWIDLEDVIGEGVVHYYRIVDKFDAERGYKFSTFIHTALENHYLSYLQRFNVGMRTGLVVSIENVMLTAPVRPSERMMEAERKVNEVLNRSSPILTRYLRSNIFDKGSRKSPDPGITEELLWICKRVGACLEDFQLMAAVASMR